MESGTGIIRVNGKEAEAIALLRRALALLDSGGPSDLAAPLQYLLDLAEGCRPMELGEEIDPELVARILGPLDVAPRGHHLGPHRRG